jgi:hypothetical protein
VPLGKKSETFVKTVTEHGRERWPVWWLNEEEIDHYSRELGYGILTRKEKEEIVRDFRRYVESLLRESERRWDYVLKDLIRDLKEIPAGERGTRIYIQREKGG